MIIMSIYRGCVKTPVLFFVPVDQSSWNFGTLSGPFTVSNVIPQ